ncbi:hypothetical protein D4764_13G0012360 [Takifugu flavidus]|uniref:Uncharacterized protein n=1 Tax=Takifugu flavidus TaxID=433684 RepID=A0A5C6P9W5_9TELE|nr:hypothetical protein D4764_13G0012360 [Takifugu flavidus]
MEILDKIAAAVFEIKGYPEKDELESVASALVLKYPCLKEPGSITGYEGWKASIKHKLGNYRSKLRRAGCNEISKEFHRITSKDLLGTFNAFLDKFVPGLLKLYRSKKGALGEKMEDLLDKLDEQTSDIVSHRKTAALRGLPIFLREDAAKVFLKCLVSTDKVMQVKLIPNSHEMF